MKLTFFCETLGLKVHIEKEENVEAKHALVANYLLEFPLLEKLFLLLKQVFYLADLLCKEEVPGLESVTEGRRL